MMDVVMFLLEFSLTRKMLSKKLIPILDVRMVKPLSTIECYSPLLTQRNQHLNMN
jgi:hypothetical protein